MSSRIKAIEAEIKGLSDKAEQVVLDASRPWSERKPESEKLRDDIKSLIEERDDLKSIADTRNLLTDATDGGEVDRDVQTVPNGATGTKSIGQQFVESASYKAADFASRGTLASADVKATFTVGSGAAGGVQPEYHMQIVPINLRRIQVTQLIPGGSISGGSLIYPKESSITDAAAAVAEGDAKPGSDLNVTQVTENLHKVATTLKVSDETLQDFVAAQSYIDGRLSLFVNLAEEDQILNGSGSGANMTGLLNRSGLASAQAVGSDTTVDAVFKQITRLRTVSFVEPDGIVINPSDWQSMRLAKDSNGQYYAGGPFSGAYGNTQPVVDQLWGLPVVVTPLIAQGTGLVGAFGMCAQIFRKGGLRVEATNSNEDDFLNNLVAIRAEIRELLAVYRPSGFGKVTGLS